MILAIYRMKSGRLLSFFEEFLRDLREFLPNLAGQPVMDSTGLYASDIRDNYRRWCSNSHNEPYDAKEKEAGQSDQFQYQRVAGRKMPYRAKGDEKHHSRNARNDH